MRISDWSSDVCSSDLISANLDGGCLYVHRGLPIFYHLAGGCIATRYPFPDHLSLAIEGVALDVDPVAEVKRILAARPAVIVTNPASPSTDNPADRKSTRLNSSH